MKSKSFADKLKELRETAGLTSYALAKQAGITKQALYRLESGSNEPTWDTVQKLAAALGVSCEAFQSAPPAADEPTPKKRKEKGKK